MRDIGVMGFHSCFFQAEDGIRDIGVTGVQTCALPICILIAAFSSLLANLLFFLPMQLGGREGGFALAVSGLSLSGAYGVYAALITRVRELFWIVVGLALMKVGNKEE